MLSKLGLPSPTIHSAVSDAFIHKLETLNLCHCLQTDSENIMGTFCGLILHQKIRTKEELAGLITNAHWSFNDFHCAKCGRLDW